jgi:methionyl-tRNA synthetase
MSTKFYVTTSIPYASGAPHIGNAIDWLYADTIARYHKQKGEQVIYSAGADEHGTKIVEKAEAANLPPQEFIETVIPAIKAAHKVINSDYTHFARTNSDQHIKAAQLLWQNMGDDIYKGTYSGWYCVGCEEYKTETEVHANNSVCPLHDRAYEKLEEENYFFKLSKYQKELENLIETNEFRVVPESRKNEILSTIKSGLDDISISRPKSTLEWGIPVPNDETQVMYVWFEALMNYITLLGYPDGEEFKDFWPTNVQIVGKDNLRFHAAIYPAMLLSAQLPMLKTLFVHGHISVGGKKMSKTIGNVVTTEEIVEKYGADAFRYYFMRHVPSYYDGDFTWERLDAIYHGELANELGNAVQRVASMVERYLGGSVEITVSDHIDSQLDAFIENCQFDKALEYVWAKVRDLNQYIEQTKPWQLAKAENTDELRVVLQKSAADIVRIGQLIAPFLPNAAAAINTIFASGTINNQAGILFPRIEA